MTIKEMFKKVEAYNEVAELIGSNKAVLEITLDVHFSEKFSTYKEFKAYIKREWIDELAKAVEGYDKYEYETPLFFPYTDKFGTHFFTEIECGIYTA